jgi:phosphatidylglycerophosphate synthase
MLKQTLSRVHGVLYDRLNTSSSTFLQKYGKDIPLWLTADAITSGRLTLVFPTTILMSQGHTWLPASLVLVNAAFDYVDGAVARWERQDKDRALALSMKRKDFLNEYVMFNHKTVALKNTWGAYYDALADKAFAIPVWCAICTVNPELPWIQAGVLAHLSIESISAYTRTKSYFTNPQTSAGVVTANATGKIKQAVSMCGTAMVLIPELQVIGGVLLWGSLPLSFASLADKLKDQPVERALVFTDQLFTAEKLVAVAEAQKKV